MRTVYSELPSTRFFVFSFFPIFFVSLPSARLSWPYRQLLNARKYTVSYRIRRLSVRLSVRKSVTCRYCTKTAKRKITQTTPQNSPWTLVFDDKDLGEILMGSLQLGSHTKVW